MRAHVINAAGIIINTIEVDSLDFMPGIIDASAGGTIGDTWDGASILPAMSKLPTEGEYTEALQAMLDAEARTHNYDGVLSACTYATSTNAKFKAEGQACVEWRDAVWAKSYEVMAQVQSGEIPQPTIHDLLAMMPAMVWPAV